MKAEALFALWEVEHERACARLEAATTDAGRVRAISDALLCQRKMRHCRTLAVQEELQVEFEKRQSELRVELVRRTLEAMRNDRERDRIAALGEDLRRGSLLANPDIGQWIRPDPERDRLLARRAAKLRVKRRRLRCEPEYIAYINASLSKLHREETPESKNFWRAGGHFGQRRALPLDRVYVENTTPRRRR